MQTPDVPKLKNDDPITLAEMKSPDMIAITES